MEMQQVRYFLAVARTLNFTRAAEESNVTQPALTRAVQQLEEELGGELIRREGRLSHLTDLGRRMQPLLEKCLEAAESAKSIAAMVKKGEVPLLTLAVSRTLDLSYLMPTLTEMHRSFPGLQLKLRRGSGSQIAAMLKAGDVDLAIGGPMSESWDRLETWSMFTEAFDLVVGADHPLAAQAGLELNIDLIRKERFLVHGGIDAPEYEIGGLEATGINLENAHEVDSDRDLEALIIADFGVAIIPASALQSAKVRHLTCSAIDLRRTVAIYSVAGRARSREASALLNLVRSADWSRRLTADALEHA